MGADTKPEDIQQYPQTPQGRDVCAVASPSARPRRIRRQYRELERWRTSLQRFIVIHTVSSCSQPAPVARQRPRDRCFPQPRAADEDQAPAHAIIVSEWSVDSRGASAFENSCNNRTCRVGGEPGNMPTGPVDGNACGDRLSPRWLRATAELGLLVTAVLWQASDGGSEVCVLKRSGRGWLLTGTVLTHEAEQPIEIRYAVNGRLRLDHHARRRAGCHRRERPARVGARLGALWSATTRPSEYRNCVDVDLSFTPATNTLPIRRLDLRVGDQAEVEVAWLTWPDLDVRHTPGLRPA